MDLDDAFDIYMQLRGVKRKVKASPKGTEVPVPDIEGIDVGKRCILRCVLVVDED
jgi:hypothetical protein